MARKTPEPKTEPQAGPRALTLEALTIVDKKGRPRITLRTDEDGEPSVQLCDATGSYRIALTITSEAGEGADPIIDLRDRDRRVRLVLGVGQRGPWVSLNGQNEVPLFDLGVEDDRARMCVGGEVRR